MPKKYSQNIVYEPRLSPYLLGIPWLCDFASGYPIGRFLDAMFEYVKPYTPDKMSRNRLKN